MDYKKKKPENIILFNINDAKKPFFENVENDYLKDYVPTSKPKSPYSAYNVNNDNWKDLEKGVHHEELHNEQCETPKNDKNEYNIEYMHNNPYLYNTCPPPISGFHTIVNPDGTYQYQLNSCCTPPYNYDNATRIPKINNYDGNDGYNENAHKYNEECIESS